MELWSFAGYAYLSIRLRITSFQWHDACYYEQRKMNPSSKEEMFTQQDPSFKRFATVKSAHPTGCLLMYDTCSWQLTKTSPSTRPSDNMPRTSPSLIRRCCPFTGTSTSANDSCRSEWSEKKQHFLFTGRLDWFDLSPSLAVAIGHREKRKSIFLSLFKRERKELVVLIALDDIVRLRRTNLQSKLCCFWH